MPPSPTLRAVLHASGAQLDSALTGWAMPPDEQAYRVIEQACDEHGASYQTFYEYLPTGATAELPAFLHLTALAAASPVAAGQLIALRDEESSTLVASARLAALLDPVTANLEWQPLDGTEDLVRLMSAPALPDPVAVPRAYFAAAGTDGTWAVQSDGRELLTAANRRTIREAGIVYAPACVLDGKVLPWRRPTIMSGPVVTLLTGQQVQGVNGAPAYLGWI